VEELPKVDEKTLAQEQFVAAGGPATNAAVAFAFLGGNASLMTALGRHPLVRLIEEDLDRHRVQPIDLAPDQSDIPAISSIMVKRGTGERSIVYVNARKKQIKHSDIADQLLRSDIVHVDGHQMEASLALCAEAHRRKIPCVLDAGSWKDKTEKLLPLLDYVICSERFFPPQCSSIDEVIKYLAKKGIRHIAISRGGKSLIAVEDGSREEIPVLSDPPAVDTTGAGDILHGAFCYYILHTAGEFLQSLTLASQVASCSCRSFGTRDWMDGTRKMFP
jgi:sugar/nucleoside kinase (ribokinase family)